ncbi:MAG: alanine racemase [Proteobacteria bacterium]|nr:alanine racemase [Desulfocapsa sp.]MBU3945915.1 alanine racemase [Pseudomonadota bacterium]MCG2744971.1 alanine racemase [Desulfobacteraceae bacterium]MBU4027479.1 alanine racemase [Pseudomonadota bacterium]MBU4042678.1 alanine racemase [Pseudomonadota bacterium]
MIHPHPSSRSFNQVCIDSSALHENFSKMQQRVGRDIRIMAMVKADAYGHGMVQTAVRFAEAGCDCFGVAEIEEGVELRRTGIQGQIFVLLGFQPSQEQLFFDYDLTPVIFDYQAMDLLSQAAVRNGKEMDFHLKVDCGMGRLGFRPSEVHEFFARLEDFPKLSLVGIMSHFPMADDTESTQTMAMFQHYKKVCMQSSQQTPVICHIANSGAALYFPKTCCDMVRLGISLYGYYPDGAEGTQLAREKKLVPAMSFTTQVVQIKTVPTSTGISYGHTFVTEKETKLAVLPVGYADGFLRSLSNRAQVLIKGQRARIIGRICMNLCMADISEISGVETGDPVVILGSQGAETITADEIAEWMGTISYEVLCLFGNNNDRNYT